MTIVVYGDFNCPYSYLASVRVDALLRTGVDVEWRAVEHAPTTPVNGRRLDASAKADLEAELSEVRGLLAPAEELPINAGGMMPRTEAAISGYAEAFGAGVADGVRRLLFEAYWVRGLDIGSPEVLRTLLAGEIKRGRSLSFAVRESGYAVSANRGPISAAAYRRIRDWRDDWYRTGTQTIPSVVPDGRRGSGVPDGPPTSRVIAGVDALDWLAARPARSVA